MSSPPKYELLVIILDDLKRLPDLLNALNEAQVPGVTLLDSIGGYRASSWLDEIGLSGLMKMFGTTELKRRVLLTVVKKEQVDGAIAAAEQAVGGFGRPNTGILFSIPVLRTVGIHDRHRSQESETLPVTDVEDKTIRDMPVSEADKLLNIAPVTITTGATLLETANALRKSPSAHVAAVISSSGHLLGLVTLRQLADHIFFGIMPEIFYGEIATDIDSSLDFGKMANVHNISDIMIEPVALHRHDTVGEAFRLMHKHDLTGLPIVDDAMHVVGFVSMLELLNLVIEKTAK